MDDVQKSRIRLSNWIDHNVEHVKGYAEVAQTLERENLRASAEMVREGIRLIEQANRQFASALALLPGQGTEATEVGTADHTSPRDHHHRHHGGRGSGHEHTE